MDPVRDEHLDYATPQPARPGLPPTARIVAGMFLVVVPLTCGWWLLVNYWRLPDDVELPAAALGLPAALALAGVGVAVLAKGIKQL